MLLSQHTFSTIKLVEFRLISLRSDNDHSIPYSNAIVMVLMIGIKVVFWAVNYLSVPPAIFYIVFHLSYCNPLKIYK